MNRSISPLDPLQSAGTLVSSGTAARAFAPVSAVIFDFGGVLLKWDPRLLYNKFFPNDPAAVERFLTEIGFEEWNQKQDAGRPFAEGVAELTRRFPAHRGLIKAYVERWNESIGGAIELSVGLLYSLKQAGCPLYGLSNWSAETFSVVRREYAFFDWFDAIVLSGEVKLLKPDTRIFEVLLQKVGRPAQECLFVDDALKNIEAAQTLGFQTHYFQTPERLEAELKARGLID